MARSVLVVLTNPRDGRDDEYNEWYDEVHLPDVLKVEGFVRAERFALGPPLMGMVSPWRYLALYEIESDDLEGSLQALANAMPSMVISDAINLKDVSAYAFTARAEPMLASDVSSEVQV